MKLIFFGYAIFNRRMKLYLTILLNLIITFSHGQLSGAYCTAPSGYGSSCLTFEEKGKFVYSSFYCTGRTYGEGKYYTINDTLILKYEEPELNFASVSELTRKGECKDSCEIFVTVVDLDTEEPLPFGQIEVASFKSTFHEELIPDFNGELTDQIACENFPLNIGISQLGYSSEELKVNEAGQLEIKFSMRSGINVKKNSTDTLCFELDESDDLLLKAIQVNQGYYSQDYYGAK